MNLAGTWRRFWSAVTACGKDRPFDEVLTRSRRRHDQVLVGTGSLIQGESGGQSAMTLDRFLKARGYRRLAMTRTAVGHLEVPGTLNGHPVAVLIDTGASMTIASLAIVEALELNVQTMGHQGAGAGGGGIEVFQAESVVLCLHDQPIELETLAAMDLAHVNQALDERGVASVDVVVGVDVLDHHQAIIDYGTDALYLRLSESETRE